jgi:hypothetical protein
MKDLDFDELDRAVNSVIGGAKKTPVVPSSEVSVTVTPAASTEQTQPSQPLAAKRSTGRFMDVVHPSSDMRPTSVPPRPSLMNKESTLAEPIKPEETKAEDSAWPDPLDFHGFKMDDEPSKPAETPAPKENLTEKDADKEPLTSPFLSDTKVEKRPLGAFSDTPEKSDKDIASGSSGLSSNDNTPLPEELQDNLLSIEADDHVDAEESTPEVATEPEKPETPVESPFFSATPEKSDTDTTIPPIVQQYKEQPSSVDQPTGAIFDTESYHKPLAHTAKKKSGWLVVVWIFALIIVGAGAGAAVFYFVLPLL